MKKFTLTGFVLLLSQLLFAQSWVPMVSPVNSELYAIHFNDDNTGWVAGFNGKIAKTTDSGFNWTLQTSPTTEHLRDIYFTNATTGYAVGYNGTLLITTDAGSTWNSQTTGRTEVLRKILFTSAMDGWIVGDLGVILSTTNGGTTWTDQTSSSSINFQDIHFINANDGYVFGMNAMLITNDGGTTWDIDTITNPGGHRIMRANWINSNEFIAVTSAGKVISTTVGATTWTVKDSLCDALRSIAFKDNQNGWAVGTGFGATNEIFKTTDGGSNWAGESGAINEAYDVEFRPSGTGFVVGSQGVILRYGNPLAVKPTQEKQASFSISPNPAQDFIVIQAEKSATYSVMDALGRKVMEFNAQSQTRVSLESLQPGIYFVRDNASGYSARIVKQ